MSVTASMLASIPFWLMAIGFFVYLFKPREAYRNREKYPIHAVMCVALGSLSAALAKGIYDSTVTMGGIISIPFWMCAAVFAVATIGCVIDRKPNETDGDLVGQFVVGSVITGVFALIGALLVKFV